MVPHPLNQIGEAAGAAAELYQRGKLRLAGPALVDDKLLRRAARDILAEIVLDEGEREVDAGGNAGRGPDIAIVNEDAVRIDADPRIAASEIVRACPMRGGAAAVEQPCFRQQIGARADAGDPPRAAAFQPGGDLFGRRQRAHDLAAGNDDRVEALVAQGRRGQADARRAFDLAATGGQHRELIAAGAETTGDLEGRRRPRGIQQLEPGMDNDRDCPFHGSFCTIYVISDKA